MRRVAPQLTLVTAETALPGRDTPILQSGQHLVNKQNLMPPYPAHCEQFLFAMGCFWGAERLFWSLPGVHVTAVGYAGGYTRNPSYEEVCSGMTGHAEAVLVVYDPTQISLKALLSLFWESHDPTQGMRQGNDQGSQYRSALYACHEQQLAEALASRERFQNVLTEAGLGQITTEIDQDKTFYFAEAAHQQYLARNPMGYCGLQGLGLSCPTSTAAETP